VDGFGSYLNLVAVQPILPLFPKLFHLPKSSSSPLALTSRTAS
jgi:hypothetical protein